MIQKLIEPLRDRLLSLPYIDSYVGLVKPIARQKEDGKEQILSLIHISEPTRPY